MSIEVSMNSNKAGIPFGDWVKYWEDLSEDKCKTGLFYFLNFKEIIHNYPDKMNVLQFNTLLNFFFHLFSILPLSSSSQHIPT